MTYEMIDTRVNVVIALILLSYKNGDYHIL
nr:MAG TPA: hypothetical protein [Caudoviricetes sp.]